MQLSDMPRKLPVPWGELAGVDYIRNIPETSQIGVEDGAASLTDGFPPLTATPLAAGGVPPNVKDFNGALRDLYSWARWQAAGGPVTFDNSFVTATGGYPQNACIQSTTTVGLFWVSKIDNNTTNPDVDATNWQALTSVKASPPEVQAYSNDTKFVTPYGLGQNVIDGGSLLANYTGNKLVSAAALAALRATLGDLLVGADGVKYATPASIAGLRASRADVSTPSSNAKFVTPDALHGAFATGTDFVKVFGILIQFGRYRFTTNSSSTVFTFNYPRPFTGAAFSVVMSPYYPNTRTYNQKKLMKYGDGNANGFQWIIRDDDSGDSGSYIYGFDWIAIGYAP